jgi:hypothetical protein
MSDKVTLAEKMADIAIKQRNRRTLSDEIMVSKYESATSYIEVVSTTGDREINLNTLADVARVQGIGNRLHLAKLLKEDGFVLKDSKDKDHKKTLVVVW